MYSIPFYRGMLKARGFLLVALCVGLSHGICHNGICDTDRCTDDDYCPSCFSCDTTCGTCKTIPNCCMSHQVEKIQCILQQHERFRFALTGTVLVMQRSIQPLATTATQTWHFASQVFLCARYQVFCFKMHIIRMR